MSKSTLFELTPRIVAGALAISSLAGATHDGWADNFRVDTKVFADGEDEAVSANTTLFQDDQVYDFLDNPTEITLLDQGRGRFVILDTTRKIRTEISTEKVLQFSAWLKDAGQKKDDPLIKFCSSPKFAIQREEDGAINFSSPVLTYTVQAATAPSDEVAAKYRRFTDWYARLNSMLHPQALMPFPRLVVNDHVGRDQLIPTDVQLTIAPQNRFGNREIQFRSQHRLRRGLTGEDMEKIEAAQRYLVTYRSVALGEYRGLVHTAQK